jgi:beta-glucosidase
MKNLVFPKGFLWGAATASHQVDGGGNSDWKAWEMAGHILDGSVAGNAADHWNRYREDDKLIDKMHLNAYRFSISWSRTEKEEGVFDQETLDQYRAMVADLKKRGITPVVTLHHFTNPIWVSQMGSWANPRTVHYFVRFVVKVVEAIGEDVTYWCTLNEPTVESTLGYLTGVWPPGKKNPWAYMMARRNLVAAHKRAYKEIHEIYRFNGWHLPQVSFAHHMNDVTASTSRVVDRFVTVLYRYFNNDYYLYKTSNYIDFIGINYYFHRRIYFKLGGSGVIWEEEPPPANATVSDLGWEIYPKGIYSLCMYCKRWKKPIIITENGLADRQDTIRPGSIVGHLLELHRALSEGADVRGYMHWSLLDTFEWENGYQARYGLIAVDFKTQKRTMRTSSKLYASIARQNALTQSHREKYL